MLPFIKNNTFYLNNEPFIMLAGEIHNSSSSSLEYMENNVWPNLRGLNMNTVLVPVAWESIEKESGVFNFSLVQGLIEQARAEKMRLVILWFGLWKNAESFYVPGWMKKDTTTYFRAKNRNGEPLNTISPFCQMAIERDKAAFTKLVEFIKKVDEKEHTVLMIQVENEIGLLKTVRDYCDAAQELYYRSVPDEVAALYQVKGTWEECFGKEAGEHFMSYAFATAVEQIASAGKKIYDIPYYANAWLEQWPWDVGTYPSGGPIIKMKKMWKAMAPSLACLAPDIYVPYVADVADEYAQEDNALFIPEVRKDAMASTYALYCILEKHAICYSPFGIEDINADPSSLHKPPLSLMQELNIDPSAFELDGSAEQIRLVYEFIENLKPLYYQYRNTGRMKNFIKRNEWNYGEILEFQNFRFKMSFQANETAKPIAGGGIIELTDHTFLIYGMRSKIEIMSHLSEDKKVGMIELAEVKVEHGKLQKLRVLNGDEQMFISLGNKLSCLFVEVYKY